MIEPEIGFIAKLMLSLHFFDNDDILTFGQPQYLVAYIITYFRFEFRSYRPHSILARLRSHYPLPVVLLSTVLESRYLLGPHAHSATTN